MVPRDGEENAHSESDLTPGHSGLASAFRRSVQGKTSCSSLESSMVGSTTSYSPTPGLREAAQGQMGESDWNTVSCKALRSMTLTFSQKFAYGHEDATLLEQTEDLSGTLEKAVWIMRHAIVAHSDSLIDRTIFEGIVRKNSERRKGCLMLLFVSIYLAVYVAVSAVFVEVPNMSVLEAPFRDALTPADSMLDFNDLWQYIDNVLVPVFFRQHDSTGELLPENEWSRVFMYDQLQKSLVLEQTRSEVRPCQFKVFVERDCHPQGSDSADPFGKRFDELPGNFNWSSVVSSEQDGFSVDGDGSGRRLRPKREELSSWLPGEGTVFRFALSRTMPLHDLRKRLEYLRLRDWLDKQTSTVSVRALVLNEEMVGKPRLLGVKVMFQVTRGGGIFTSIRFQTVPLHAQSSSTATTLYIVLLFLMLLDMVAAIKHVCHAHRNQSLRRNFKRAPFTFQVITVGLSFVVVAGFLLQRSFMQSTQAIMEEDTLTPQEVDVAVNFNSYYLLFVTYYSLFLLVRLFVSLEFQPRLGVVIRTLKATAVDLAHFMVIIIPTFFAYAISGTCIFGRRVDGFASITRSLGSCFKIAIETEFDWAELATEDFYTAMSWVWTFLILICLILLNMILAIIMDVFQQIRIGSVGEETLWDSLSYYVWHLYIVLSGNVVSDHEILQRMRLLPPVVTVGELRATLSDMHNWELNRLISAAGSQATATMLNEAQASSTRGDLTAAVKLGMDRIAMLVKHKRARLQAKRDSSTRLGTICYGDVVQSIDTQRQWSRTIAMQAETLDKRLQ
eukprot:TRINITY_DN14347_c0_g2_i1.p1 TRINITY_DN14347_c0_g2~~TRINITY_DN14347_c0_g2_i1.p1  ORF type:complete len:786 (-),score=126.97 TRINITY_DN14347_c0_g2_i1:38-2395(-)